MYPIVMLPSSFQSITCDLFAYIHFSLQPCVISVSVRWFENIIVGRCNAKFPCMPSFKLRYRLTTCLNTQSLFLVFPFYPCCMILCSLSSARALMAKPGIMAFRIEHTTAFSTFKSKQRYSSSRSNFHPPICFNYTNHCFSCLFIYELTKFIWLNKKRPFQSWKGLSP